MRRSDDDQRLMLRYQSAGDAAAFETLYRRHKDALLRYVRQLSGSEAIAADIVQHIWLKLIEMARDGRYHARKQASFRAWLYTLARNRYLDTHRRKHEETRTQSLESLPVHPEEPALQPDVAVDAAGRASLLHRALPALPAEQREVVVLWAQGWTTAEIAALTASPSETVASRRKYAVKRLRRLLADLGLQRESA